MDLFSSLGRSQIQGANFRSQNFQGPKVHITVLFLPKQERKQFSSPWFEFLNHLVVMGVNPILLFKSSGPKQQFFERKRHGVQPLNGIPGFSLHFSKELSYGYLRFEGNGKIPSNLR